MPRASTALVMPVNWSTPAHPERGVAFNGRVAEDFKLTTGTWVSVGTLRLRLVSALAPYAQDAVITGHDHAEVGALVFPSAAAQALSPERAARSMHGTHCRPCVPKAAARRRPWCACSG